MLRFPLFTVLLAGCAINDNGQLILCVENVCETDTDQGPPSDPIRFSFDRGLHQAFEDTPTVARGGRLQVDVSAIRDRPIVTEQSDVLSMTTTPSGITFTLATVRADAVGTGVVAASLVDFGEHGTMAVRIAELDSIGIAMPFEAPSDHVLVLPDVRQLAIYAETAEGERLIDHSLALDPSTPPGFALPRWDTLSIPAAPGDYLVALTRATGELHHVEVRVLDHVDEIVAVDVEEASAGTLCVNALVDGEVVKTGAFTFTGAGSEVVPFPNTAYCVNVGSATPGSTVTFEVAGTSRVFSI